MPSTRAERPRTLDPYLGAVLAGRHRIERLIGRGGMGLVYLATDIVNGGELVIKLLAPHWMEDSTAVARFDREGKRLQELAHPNVVKMLECGHDRGQTYIAMEYLDGEPLRRFLKRRGPLPLQEFTPITVQVLSAVGYAHDLGIMLRDIKPANIMLCERDGKASFVKLLDFGLAKLVNGDDEEVTKSHVIGTAGYLAPEQIKGEPCDLRADVYAIGVLLYLMLSGESPIQGENDGALLYNHVHGTPRPLGSLLPPGSAIPEALVALVHQCLEKDPARRPADANEVVEALFECVPPKMFALPDATAASREELAEYRSARDRGLDTDAGPPSSEWTKPVVRPAGESSPADASTAALPRPPRRGTPTLPPPRRSTYPEISARPTAPAPAPAVVVPPVRMPRTKPVDVAVIPAPGDTLAAGPAATTVSTPRPGDTGLATETMTPLPEDGDDAVSGALAVPTARSFSRPWWLVGGVLAAALGVLVTWAVFGSGAPTAGSPMSAAATAPSSPPTQAAPPSDSPGPTPGGAPSSPTPPTSPILVPVSPPLADEEPEVIPESPKSPVVVRAIAGARVEIDGVDAGAAPLQTALTVGTHVVRIVAPGHAPWEQTIEVVGGQNPIVEARLRAVKKRKPSADGGEVEPDDGGEPDAPSEPLPEKKPPIKPTASPTTEAPKPRPPPPPAPEPTRDPFLPTGSG